MRIVLDTNVVASALLWGGVPSQVLQVIDALIDRGLLKHTVESRS